MALTTIMVFMSCGPRNLSESKADAAPGQNDLEIWDEEEIRALETQPSIWDITKRHGSFATFSLLIETAGLEETFRSDQQITVLAPTDEAFERLGEGSIEQLLKEDNRQVLEELLLDHVIPEVYQSADFLDGKTARTLSGNSLPISKNMEIRLSNATVTTADIKARNGVVHVVDQVVILKE